jgi:hypothetical protein
MRRLLCALPALLLAFSASAQHSGGAFSVLSLESAPRTAALGGLHAALGGSDPAQVFYNPALLLSDGSTLSLGYLNHLAGLNAGFAAYGRRVRGVDAAVGVRYLSYGELQAADALGEQTGTFSAGDLALTLGASYSVSERLRVGANAHVVTSGIDDARATALAGDLAAAFTVPSQALTASVSLHHAGAVVSSLAETTDRLPLDLRVSVSKRLQYLPLLLTVTGYRLTDPGGTGTGDQATAAQIARHVRIGGELQFSPTFQVRAGFSPERNQDLRTRDRLDFAGLTGGFGLKVSRFYVDYAFQSWSENGTLHYLGLRTAL